MTEGMTTDEKVRFYQEELRKNPDVSREEFLRWRKDILGLHGEHGRDAACSGQARPDKVPHGLLGPGKPGPAEARLGEPW